MHLVTVLLPYRDAAPTLDEAIRSIRAQRGVTLELVLVNDRSTDGGDRIAARHAAEDPRMRTIDVPSSGGGLPAALMCGLEAARGDLIARMDADDIAHPERLRVQLDALSRAPRVAALGTWVEGFTSGEPLGEGMRAYIAWLNSLVTPEEHARDLFVESPLCHPSVLFRRDAVEAVGAFRDVPWAEDYDLWLRLASAGWDLAKVPSTLLRWRHHGGRATFRDARYAPPQFHLAKARYLAPRLRARGRPLAMWGAGQTGRRFARALEGEGMRVTRFFDIDPRKVGRIARGVRIEGADVLRDLPKKSELRPYFVAAVGARGAREIVRARFAAAELAEGDDYVCVA